MPLARLIESRQQQQQRSSSQQRVLLLLHLEEQCIAMPRWLAGDLPHCLIRNVWWWLALLKGGACLTNWSDVTSCTGIESCF